MARDLLDGPVASVIDFLMSIDDFARNRRALHRCSNGGSLEGLG